MFVWLAGLQVIGQQLDVVFMVIVIARWLALGSYKPHCFVLDIIALGLAVFIVIYKLG